jgi:8-oxo-dGTP diphosphatase
MQKLSPEILRRHKGISFVGVTTSFLCHDGQGRFFMTKRSNKARDERGRWEVGAGGLKWGLSARDNMLREVKEEYNATPLKVEFLDYRDMFRQLDDGTPTHWLALDYAVLVDPKEVKINEPDMFDDAGWFTLNSLPSPLHSQMEAYVTKYSKELQKILK